MKEIFDVNRFGKYFSYDLNRAVTRYGLTALIIGLMPILFLLFGFVFAFIFGKEFTQSSSLYQSWPIAAFLILVMSFGPRVWGGVTDRKQGTDCCVWATGWSRFPFPESIRSCLSTSCSTSTIWISLRTVMDPSSMWV